MPYEEVSDPIPFPQSFERFDGAAAQSQAAFLLLLGTRMRTPVQWWRLPSGLLLLSTRPMPDSEVAQKDQFLDIFPEEDRNKFPLPPILSSPKERLAGEEIRTRLISRDSRFRAISHQAIPREDKREILAEILPDLAQRLNTEPSWLAAEELIEACLSHPAPLLRVAAAASSFEISSESGRLLRILEQGTHDQESLVRDVAATALARVAPAHPRLVELTAPSPVSEDGDPSHTSLLVHGTSARGDKWWQPGGNFHSYLLKNICSDLYGDQDVFSWSGLYSHVARDLGAQDLIAWSNTHGMDGLDHLLAHSHGGSVAMSASKKGLAIEKLILLSCPVHSQYMPDFDQVKNIISIRVRFDLVILADGGGQKYNHPQIQEHVLPVWFKHSATRDPNVWQKHNIQALL